MVEQAVNQNEVHEHEQTTEGRVIKISGTIMTTLGKVALAVGVTGLLMFLFMSAEAFIGLSAVYTGAAAVASGLGTMMLGNRLSNGFWTDGVLTA